MSASSLRYGPVHANSNVICAVDIRVGGLEPDRCDLLEIAILPINHSYKVHPEFRLFHTRIRPSWPVDLKVAKLSKDKLKEYQQSSFDSIGAFGIFEHWCRDVLQLKEHKKIMPLVWDWAKIKPYLMAWAGPTNFEDHFSEVVRDLLPVMSFVNDRTDFFGDTIQYPIPKFTQLCTRNHIEIIERNSTVANVKGLVDANYELIRGYLPG